MKESAAIAALRRDIDRMDDAIHDLLLARAERAGRIGAAKTDGAAIRPAREAQILRRLAARHHGPLPVETLFDVWRTVFLAKARMQAPFCVHVADPDLFEPARDACGSAPLNRHPSPDAVLDALQDDPSALGILPMPSADNDWWRRLARDLSAGAGHRIVTCLPFLSRKPQAVMLARAPYESSGSDTSLLALNEESPADAEKILKKTGLTVIKRISAKEKEGARHLLFVDGHLAAGESLPDELTGRGVLLGGYPNPLSGDAGESLPSPAPLSAPLSAPGSAPGPAPFPRPEILSIPPYVPGVPAGEENVMRLASNESPFGAPPAAVEALCKSAAGMHAYPDDGAPKLRQALADHHKLDRDRIVCGAGSDQLLELIARAWLAPGDEAIHCRHSFLFYPMAILAAGGRPVGVLEKNFRADVDAILAAVTPRTRIVFLANPDNPTGSCLAASEVARLHAGLDPGILMVLDAAYAEYAEQEDSIDGALNYDAGFALADSADNVIVTRTFSKIYGLAGLRAGWCYGSAGLIDVLNRLRDPFNLSAAAGVAACAALTESAFIRRAAEHNTVWRGRLEETLRTAGLCVPAGAANFVIAGFPASSGRGAEQAHEFLRRRGILVRPLTAYGLPDHLRITVGLAEAVEAVGDGLTAFMQGADS